MPLTARPRVTDIVTSVVTQFKSVWLFIYGKHWKKVPENIPYSKERLEQNTDMKFPLFLFSNSDVCLELRCKDVGHALLSEP
jgi:hypothetical protein